MKDAKGHGSNARGGTQATMDRLAAARQNPNHPLGALTNAVSGAVARGTATPIAGVPAHQSGVDAVGQKEPPIPTLYKKDSDGTVFAAFPTEPGDMNPSTMMSYAHIGQHSAADQGYVASAKPAKPAEYADLHKELQGIGYNPQPIRRMTQAHYEARKAALKG